MVNVGNLSGGFRARPDSTARVYPTDHRAWARVKPEDLQWHRSDQPNRRTVGDVGNSSIRFHARPREEREANNSPGDVGDHSCELIEEPKLDRGDGRAGATTPSFPGSRDSPDCPS